MLTESQLNFIFPLAVKWVQEQETLILENGIELSDDQKIDAFQVGVKNINKVRILKVKQIPSPEEPVLKDATRITGILSCDTIGIALGYGIYITEDYWNVRRLIVHELTHTMQYERFGSIESFLKTYLHECFTVGYEKSPLELEARNMEIKICC